MGNRKWILGVLAAVLASNWGCAHTADRKLDGKLAQESNVTSREQLSTYTSQSLENAKQLTADQKNQLIRLREVTRNQTNSLHSDSLKLRAILVDDIVSSNYDEDEVKLIKKRIRALEEKRISLLFDAVDKANEILGHDAFDNQHVMRDYLFEAYGSKLD